MRSPRAASTASKSSNKLLVLIDGRSIYSTLHSGVFWQLHSPLLEDIQQIEVISGPGGTLYGPNAVNGVISIASRDARETLGGLVRGTAGAFERTIGGRYGVALGSTGAIRFYGNYFDRDALARGPIGPAIDDAFSGWQAGMRADVGIGRLAFHRSRATSSTMTSIRCPATAIGATTSSRAGRAI